MPKFGSVAYIITLIKGVYTLKRSVDIRAGKSLMPSLNMFGPGGAGFK
jgi:hypothetical protein